MTDEDLEDIDVRDIMGDEVEEKPKNFDRFVRQQRNRITETVYFIYDVRDGSELFQPLPEDASYVTAISGTGEWIPHKTRKEAVSALHPWAKWSDTETRLMDIKAIIDKLTMAAQECLAGHIPTARLEEVADMLLDEAETFKRDVLPLIEPLDKGEDE
jgi:hypothetical protein